ncbi:MAG: FAD-binding oxidoreductase [Hyphomicrobiaceae bacterium]|nr:FAD-binding oxidoreductase [Hyphomicrobiaceae bacterium]
MRVLKQEPYWWEEAPPRSLPTHPVEARSDVAIVGAGYTGLSAALILARAGRSVQVFDRMRPGEGASSRNGGIASGSIRPGLREMTARFGEARATAIQAEAKAAREHLAELIRTEGIECDFAMTGRFTGAANTADYDALAREAELLNKSIGVEIQAVPRSGQRAILGTDFYHGGVVRMDIGGLHPAKLHAELLRLALAAGVRVHGETAVTGVRPDGETFEVETARRRVRAAHVITGTNGYTDGADPWLRRRLVPVRSRMIATAPLSGNLMRQLMPRGVMCSETRKLHYYYRPSPDGTRILLGGRDGSIAGDPQWPTDNLRRALADIFPELDDVEISHSWFGHVAMNRDMVPRIFTRRGVRYATGYCGSGVVWATWAGRKASLQVLGADGAASALDFRPPPAIPFYNGRPWFLPVVFGWMTLQDRLAARRRKREHAA